MDWEGMDVDCSLTILLPSKVQKFPDLVRITSYPPRLQLQTSRKGFILMGKMTFRIAKCFDKVVHTIDIGVLNIQTPVRINPFTRGLKNQTLWIGVILMGRMTLSRAKSLLIQWRQVSLTSKLL